MSKKEKFEQKLAAEKRASVGHLLFRAARLWNELAIGRIQRQTGIHVKLSHTAMFPHLALEGSRITDLAERMGISKQAVGKMVDEMESLGFLERIPDPEDRRAKLVRFSEKGRGGLLQGLVELQKVETDLTRHTGKREMQEIHRLLTGLLDALEKVKTGET